MVARPASVEEGYGHAFYELHRQAVGIDLTLGRVARHLDVAPATNAEIDAALEQGQ